MERGANRAAERGWEAQLICLNVFIPNWCRVLVTMYLSLLS